ncbi:response regulator [bacterium]|nr:response regulator [bacterium]
MTNNRILIVDDNAENLYILRVLLQAAGFEVDSANHGAEALKFAKENLPRLIVSDILMPVMDGFSLCREWMADETLKDVPFLFYTATYTDDRDRDFALSLGATRFIIKPEEPDVLMEIIRETIDQKDNADSQKEEEEGPAEKDLPEDAVYLKQYNEALIRKLEKKMEDLNRTNQELKEDIARREATEKRLFLAHEFLGRIIENIPNLVYLKQASDLRYVRINRAVEDFLGIDRNQLVGKTDHEFWPPEMADSFTRMDREVLTSKQPLSIPEEEVQDIRGEIHYMRTRKVPVLNAAGEAEYLLGISEDITEQKNARKERQELERQLIQAQKMESIGRLAGGVAHDFNNKLFIILSRAELLLGSLPEDSPIRVDLEEILNVASSSAELTRQLLAFARKQAVVPVVIDLNGTMESILNMLGRLVGSNIDLKWVPGEGLKNLQMDPSQIDQILANLVINARDAIGTYDGQVTITSRMEQLDEHYCDNHIGFLPGEYVVISVSDNGCGMDEETQAKVFEPFFTTKAPGEGTGLGLATVFGIVKQNEGFVHLESRPGEGTTFTIYLPAYHGKQQASKKTWSESKSPAAGGAETILLVEDDPAILNLATKIMERLNYKVISAATPADAIATACDHDEAIHLLITDMMLPEMTGRELVDELKKYHSEISCLYISGYASQEVLQQLSVEERPHFLQKPFSIKQLAAKVQEVLGP